jgi:hypothetical protein
MQVFAESYTATLLKCAADVHQLYAASPWQKARAALGKAAPYAKGSAIGGGFGALTGATAALPEEGEEPAGLAPVLVGAGAGALTGGVLLGSALKRLGSSPARARATEAVQELERRRKGLPAPDSGNVINMFSRRPTRNLEAVGTRAVDQMPDPSLLEVPAALLGTVAAPMVLAPLAAHLAKEE